MNQKTKQIIIAVVVIVVAFIGIKYFLSTRDSGAPLTTDVKQTEFVDGKSIVLLLNRLNLVTLDDSIFSSSVFVGLYNFEKVIPDEVVGRLNPFAPIGADGSAATIRAVSSSTPAQR